MLREVTITRTVDHDGERIVLVPVLGSSTPAKLFEEDYNRLIASSLTVRWTFSQTGTGYRYVCATVGGGEERLTTVARLILGTGAGKCVRYADGDRLNMRADNFRVAKPGNAHRKSTARLVEGKGTALVKLPTNSHQLIHRWNSPDRRLFQAIRKVRA